MKKQPVPSNSSEPHKPGDQVKIVPALFIQSAATVPPGEYENHAPTRPDLIPADEADARLRLEAVVPDPLHECSKQTFLRAWWALCWLNPGLHPDDCGEWEDPAWQQIATEAFRRFEAREIDGPELYPAEATHNRVWNQRKEQNTDPH